MGCSGVDVKLSRFGCISRTEHHIAFSTTDVEGFLVVQFIDFVTHLHTTFSSHVEDTNLTTGSEMRSLQRVDSFQQEFFLHRHRTTHNHAVVHGIHQIHFILREYLLNEEVATQTLGVIAFGILRMCCVADFIVSFHCCYSFSFFATELRNTGHAFD